MDKMNDIRTAIQDALKVHSMSEIRRIIEDILSEHNSDDEAMECPECKSPLKPVCGSDYNIPHMKCNECGYVCVIYRGVCRTSRRNNQCRGIDVKRIVIRSLDNTGRERAIELIVSSRDARSIELKAKDKFTLLIAAPEDPYTDRPKVSLFYNETINKLERIDSAWTLPFARQFAKRDINSVV